MTSRAEKRVYELLLEGCPQCEQKEEFEIHREAWHSKTFTALHHGPLLCSFSEDEDKEFYIMCPACEWMEQRHDGLA